MKDRFKTLYDDLWDVSGLEFQPLTLSVDINYGDMKWGLESTYNVLHRQRLIKYAPAIFFPTSPEKHNISSK